MKIGLLIDDSLDRPDGVQQYMMTVGDWMSQQGHEVHYITTRTQKPPRSHVHSLSRSLKASFNGNNVTVPMRVSRTTAQAFLASQEFDVLHVQVPYSPFFSGRLIKYAAPQTAVIGTFHILPYSNIVKYATRVLGVFSRRSQARFDSCFSVSVPAQQFAKQYYGLDSAVLPNAADLSLFTTQKQPSKKGKKRILFLGRLVKRKGCLQFLRALRHLPITESDIRVDIAGDGPDKAKLQSYVKRHLRHIDIRFHGFVGEQNKITLLRQATLAVFPSLGGESFGIVLLEAMASQSPVVLAGDNPGYNSVMGGRTSQLFNPAKPQEIAQSIQAYLNSDAKRKAALKWQKNHVKQFDVSYVGQQLLDEYRAVLQSK